jgi:hypothetical protein
MKKSLNSLSAPVARKRSGIVMACLTGLTLVAAIYLLDHSRLRAQSDDYWCGSCWSQGDFVPAPPPTSPDNATAPATTVIIAYTQDQGITAKGDDQGPVQKLAGLQPDQIVTVTVQYGTDKTGHLIDADALDGGQIQTPPQSLVVDNQGNLTLVFKVGHEPGLYQLALRDGSTQELGVQFWVIDNQLPADNPAVATPGNGG